MPIVLLVDIQNFFDEILSNVVEDTMFVKKTCFPNTIIKQASWYAGCFCSTCYPRKFQ